jgi:hypothetical protein
MKAKRPARDDVEKVVSWVRFFGQPTFYRIEGPGIAAIRSHKALLGWLWEAADEFARAVVAQGLKESGAGARPEIVENGPSIISTEVFHPDRWRKAVGAPCRVDPARRANLGGARGARGRPRSGRATSNTDQRVARRKAKWLRLNNKSYFSKTWLSLANPFRKIST